MEGLMALNLEKNDITTWDFDAIKTELGRILSPYEPAVYTDDTIKTAKNDKATLAKAKKAVEDQRKAFKAKCLAPYAAGNRRCSADGLPVDQAGRNHHHRDTAGTGVHDRGPADGYR